MVTTQEAELFIRTYRGDRAGDTWLSGDLDAQAALNRAMVLVDSLPFIGHKLDEEQEHAFPRQVGNKDIGIPDAVKAAISLEALDDELARVNRDQSMEQLKQLGVSSYALDDFSVSFREDQHSKRDAIAELSDLSVRLLRPYLLSGGAVYVTY